MMGEKSFDVYCLELLSGLGTGYRVRYANAESTGGDRGRVTAFNFKEIGGLELMKLSQQPSLPGDSIVKLIYFSFLRSQPHGLRYLYWLQPVTDIVIHFWTNVKSYSQRNSEFNFVSLMSPDSSLNLLAYS